MTDEAGMRYTVATIRIGGMPEAIARFDYWEDVKTFVAAYMEREYSGDCAGMRCTDRYSHGLDYECEWDADGSFAWTGEEEVA